MSQIVISEKMEKPLDILVQLTGESIQAIIEDAVDSYARKLILEKANKAYEELRANPELWAQELEERKEWEVTLSDGLDEPYD